MDEETRLKESHDISEALQIEIEKLDNVERAFVHVDYEGTHAPVCLFFFFQICY